MSITEKRIMEERKLWRKDHPYGFFARPRKTNDGSTNLYLWDCGVPGKANSKWAGAQYKVTIKFDNSYPTSAPLVSFEPGFFHVNVYDSGKVCLSIIGDSWKSSITVKQILLGVQDLLSTPNINSAAQRKAATAFRNQRSGRGNAYDQGIERMVRKYKLMR